MKPTIKFIVEIGYTWDWLWYGVIYSLRDGFMKAALEVEVALDKPEGEA